MYLLKKLDTITLTLGKLWIFKPLPSSFDGSILKFCKPFKNETTSRWSINAIYFSNSRIWNIGREIGFIYHTVPFQYDHLINLFSCDVFKNLLHKVKTNKYIDIHLDFWLSYTFELYKIGRPKNKLKNSDKS